MSSFLNIDLPVLIEAIGYLGIFIIVFAESGLFFGFFLPGDSLLFTAGLLSASGYFDITLLTSIIALGAILGDQVGYWFGKKVGPKIFTRDDSFYFKKEHLTKAETFYQKHGRKTIIFARFIPIVRTFAPILAGVGKMNYKIFLTYNIVGGIFWSASVTLLGYILGESIPNIDRYLLPFVGLVILMTLLSTISPFIYKKFKKIS